MLKLGIDSQPDLQPSGLADVQERMFLKLGFATDSPLEGTGFEPSVPVEENQLTRAPRLTATGVSPRRSDTCACRPVAVAIRADTVVGGTGYIANLQCPRLSHYAASNKTRIMLE